MEPIKIGKKKSKGPRAQPIIPGMLYISNGKGKLARVNPKNASTLAVQTALKPFCYETKPIPGLPSVTVQVPNKLCLASDGPLILLADSPDCLFNLTSLLNLLPTVNATVTVPASGETPATQKALDFIVGTMIQVDKRDNPILYTMPYSVYRKYFTNIYKVCNLTEEAYRACKPTYKNTQTIQKLRSS